MDDCPHWLKPRVEAAFARALGSLRPAEIPAEEGGLVAQRVRIHSLTGRADLNGHHGWVVRFSEEKGRYQTKVESDAGESVLLRPANLEVAADSEDDSPALTLLDVFKTVSGARRNLFHQRALDWIDRWQMVLCDRSRQNSAAFRVTHSMQNDDRHPGRAALLGLPTSDRLLDDLAENECIVQFFAVWGIAERIACWWGNRSHARNQLAEWYEAEGDFAAAEPLYALVYEQSRAGSPHEAASFADRGHSPIRCVQPTLRATDCHRMPRYATRFFPDPPRERCMYINNYALCLKRQKHYARAIQLYREAVKMPGCPPVIRQNLAQCEMQVSQPVTRCRSRCRARGCAFVCSALFTACAL